MNACGRAIIGWADEAGSVDFTQPNAWHNREATSAAQLTVRVNAIVRPAPTLNYGNHYDYTDARQLP